MIRWICKQKCYTDPLGGDRKRVYLPGDEISLPEDIVPPDHIWGPSGEARPKVTPIDSRLERKQQFPPPRAPIDPVKAEKLTRERHRAKNDAGKEEI